MDFFEENEIVVKTNFIEQLKYMTIVLLTFTNKIVKVPSAWRTYQLNWTLGKVGGWGEKSVKKLNFQKLLKNFRVAENFFAQFFFEFEQKFIQNSRTDLKNILIVFFRTFSTDFQIFR